MLALFNDFPSPFGILYSIIHYLIIAIPESESDSEVDESHEGTTILKLDDWVAFKVDPETAQLILHLRQKWNALFLRRMKNPSKIMSQQDEQVIKALVTVITREEQATRLQQPLGIGQRPRPLLVDYYPASARRTGDYEEVRINKFISQTYSIQILIFNIIYVLDQSLVLYRIVCVT